MKAGKSTLLNAIVCQDLLPSRGPAMTVLPTHVVPVCRRSVPEPVLTLASATAAQLGTIAARLTAPDRRTAVDAAMERHPQLASAAARSQQQTGSFPRRLNGTEAVRQGLADLNDLLRLALLALPEEIALREVRALRAPEVVVPVPWLASDPAGGWLVLVDTPGPDEDLLPGVLNHFVEEEIRRAHEVLVILDATRHGSTAEAVVARLLTTVAPSPGRAETFTVLNRADLVGEEEPRPGTRRLPIAAGASGHAVRTVARQGLAAASVLWSQPGTGQSGKMTAHFLRTVFPLDWEERTASLSAERVHTLAQQTWDRSGIPAVMDQFIDCRGRDPGGWALARLLARLAPLTGPPAPPQHPAAPRKPPNDLADLANRRHQVAHAARSHYAGLAIEWR
ncbi:dynamin family protein [Streptomyces sp. NPDC052236]|uniref:dynamin family protein n=1 Tax=Streptomyces sp. NPDC052236 TaxID=3365686 RepID=UPI0037D8F1E2